MIIHKPEPARWAGLRPWSRVAVIRRLWDQRRHAVTELQDALQTAMELPTGPKKIAELTKLTALHRQALAAAAELELAVFEAEAVAAG